MFDPSNLNVFDMNTALSRLIAHSIFYPTLGWNLLLGKLLKLRNWWDAVDDHIILGALPFSSDVPTLAAAGVTGVVNTCEEYAGPENEYQRFGIEQFRMPTVDFTHPSFEDVCRAVEFIQRHANQQGKIYVHCKAGRARSATVVMCWLIKSQQLSAEKVQQLLNAKRPHINPHIHRRPVVREFENRYLLAADSN